MFFLFACVYTFVKIFIIKTFFKNVNFQENSHLIFVEAQLIVKLFQEQAQLFLLVEFFHWPYPLQACLHIPAKLLSSAGPCHHVCLRLSFPCPEGPGCKLSLLSVFRRDGSLDFRWHLIASVPSILRFLMPAFCKATWSPPKWHVGRYKRHKTLPLRFMLWGWGYPTGWIQLPTGADALLLILTSLTSIFYSWRCSRIYFWNPILTDLLGFMNVIVVKYLRTKWLFKMD